MVSPKDPRYDFATKVQTQSVLHFLVYNDCFGFEIAKTHKFTRCWQE